MCWVYDGEAIQRDGLLQGYNGMVWTVVGLQVCREGEGKRERGDG